MHAHTDTHTDTHTHAYTLHSSTGSDNVGPAELGLHTPQSHAIAMMCRCDGTTDEGVELQVLKGLLTATTSSTFTVHGQVCPCKRG